MALLSNPTATHRVAETRVAWLRVTPYLGGPTIKARHTLARDGITRGPDKRPLPRCAHTPVAQSLGAAAVLPLQGGSGGFGVSSQFESLAPNTRPIRIWPGGTRHQGFTEQAASPTGRRARPRLWGKVPTAKGDRLGTCIGEDREATPVVSASNNARRHSSRGAAYPGDCPSAWQTDLKQIRTQILYYKQRTGQQTICT